MVPNYFLYRYNYPECHLRKIWPQFWANRHFPDGDGHYGGLHTKWQTKALPMACNRQSLSWARILLLLILTHSVTQTDSIVAYTSLGSKLQKQFLWHWYCGKKQIEMWFIVVCTVINNEYTLLPFSQTFSHIVSTCWASLQKFLKRKSDAYK